MGGLRKGENMEHRNLANLKVPVVGMGTSRTFDVSSDSDIAVRREIINSCVTSGVTFIDSSPMYGESERVVGLSLHGQRHSFQLATKVWCTGREQGIVQIDRSFQLFQTDHIDVFQVHNLVDWRTHLPALERLKEEGRVGVVGITHYITSAYPEMMEIMRTGRIGAVQVPYNLWERDCESRLLPLAEEMGIGVIVMRPLGRGELVTGLKHQPDLAPLAGHGIHTWAQALLAWILSDHRVSVVIPASSRPERIVENAAAGQCGPLPQELWAHVSREAERCL
ncbi:MAG: aldo/keto reductase [Dehalococcoidia bacterium]|nr:aldo/keto reductase [Dehalococcoidia bacterium]